MDQSAVGHDYVAKVEKHESQRDYSAGFGGKFGVQSDRQDKVVKISEISWVSFFIIGIFLVHIQFFWT